MDILTAVLQAPISTVLIFAGIVIVFFAFFEVSKEKGIRLRSGKTNTLPVIVGTLFIIGGIAYKLVNTPPATPTPPMVDITLSSPTPPPTVTFTLPPATATATETPTPVPSDTPEPIVTPQIKTLSDQCFASQTWHAASINSDILQAISNADDCLNLSSLGISALSGGKIQLFALRTKAKVSSGISLPVTDQSVIEFKFLVRTLNIDFPDAPAYITFSIAPQNNPAAERGSGRFKLVVDKPGSSAAIFYFLANVDQAFGSNLGTQHPLYDQTYVVRLVLSDLTMKIYIDGTKLKNEVTIPPGPKVFYLGYNLPVPSDADVQIADLTIDGKTP